MNQPLLPDVRPDHFSFSVPDIEQAIAFWRDVFGFAVEQRFEIAFTVPDAQAAIDALVRRGVCIAAVQRSFSEPMLPEADPSMDAARSKRPAVAAFIQDPAGSLIEIIGRPGG